MKYFVFLLNMLLVQSVTFGQVHSNGDFIAVSEDGRRFILKSDGRWELAPKAPIEVIIEENKSILIFENGTWAYKDQVQPTTTTNVSPLKDSVSMKKAFAPVLNQKSNITAIPSLSNSNQKAYPVVSVSVPKTNELPTQLTQRADTSAVETTIKIAPPTNDVKKEEAQTTKTVRGKRVNYVVSFDTTKWKLEKANVGDYTFELIGKNAYATMITGRKKMTREKLESITISNAKSQAANIKVVGKEVKTVNGKEITLLQMEGTIEGMSYTYYGYIFAGEDVAVQFISYTTSKLFDEYKPYMESLLNGMVIAEK